MFFGWVFALISLGGQAPHVRCTPMVRTRGEPSEIELTPIGAALNGSGRVHRRRRWHRRGTPRRCTYGKSTPNHLGGRIFFFRSFRNHGRGTPNHLGEADFQETRGNAGGTCVFWY